MFIIKRMNKYNRGYEHMIDYAANRSYKCNTGRA